MSFWRDPSGRTRALLVGFGVVALFGMLIAGTKFLVQGDVRQLVVTMANGVSEADRQALKDDCGHLPGVGLVPDKGRADRQYRFPVRFTLRNTTAAQESALTACVDRHASTVRGYITEGDGT